MARRPKPWYRRSRAVWFVTIGGVQHNLGPDKKEAYERFHQLMRQPQRRKVSSRSLAALFDEFLDWVGRNRSPESYESYRYRLQRFIEHYPDLRSDQLRPYHVEKWAGSYDIAQTTRRNYMRAVKRCMRWAKGQGYIEVNPIDDLEIPAAEHRELVIRPKEFERLLTFVRNDDFRDLLIVSWETGCRPQESLRVTADHVDLEHKRWVFQRSEAKMKRQSRIVYLSDEAMAITRRLTLKNPSGPLFRNTNGKPWTPRSVNCAFIALQRRMGIDEMGRRGEQNSPDEIAEFVRTLSTTKLVKGEVCNKTDADLRMEAKQKLRYRRATQLATKYSLYTLRHSWATRALENGLDSLTVAVLMGHRDPSMLARVYQHLSHNPEHLLEQARKAAS